MKQVCLTILFILISSCAQRIKVPINRMHSPEAIGYGAEVEYHDIGFSSGVIDFSNNSTSDSLQMGTAKDEELYFGLGVAQNADIFIRVPEESSSMIGIKVQVYGEPAKAAAEGHNIAFTMAMGSERDSFDNIYTIDLKSDATDFSVIHGYRFSPVMMVYDGVSLSNYSFTGTVKDDTSLDSNSIDYHAKNILGADVGVIFGTHQFKLKVEVAAQRITWSNTETKLFQHFGMALAAGW